MWLLSSNISTQRPCKKLDWKRLGPYLVSERIGTQAYRLQLPPSLKVHPVFHVSLLDRYAESDIPSRIQPPAPLVIVDSQLEFEVEEILDSRLMRNRLFYLVKWKGYPVSDNSWEPSSHLSNSQDLVTAFHFRYPSKPSALLSPPPGPREPKGRRSKRRVASVGTYAGYSDPSVSFFLPA